jgi:hypothetical protein
LESGTDKAVERQSLAGCRRDDSSAALRLGAVLAAAEFAPNANGSGSQRHDAEAECTRAGVGTAPHCCEPSRSLRGRPRPLFDAGRVGQNLIVCRDGQTVCGLREDSSGRSSIEPRSQCELAALRTESAVGPRGGRWRRGEAHQSLHALHSIQQGRQGRLALRRTRLRRLPSPQIVPDIQSLSTREPDP